MVLVVHAGEFKYGAPGPKAVCSDFYYAGYQCAIIEHRLADPGLEMHAPRGDQPADDHGYAPEQYEDVAMAVAAARTGSTTHTAGLVDGNVACVGGSSGASHCASVAAQETFGGDKSTCSVMLSGIYDYHNPDDWILNCGADLAGDFFNYVGCNPALDPTCAGDDGKLDVASPYKNFSALSSPVAFYCTQLDTIPIDEYNMFVAHLTFVGATFTSRVITETPMGTGCTRHSFNFWYANPPDQPDSVITEAIAFVETYCPTP
jgi:hypothetical protein